MHGFALKHYQWATMLYSTTLRHAKRGMLHIWSCTLQGKLRIGLQEQGLLAALAQSVLLEREGASNRGGGLAQQLEEASQIVKQVYSECPTFDELVPALLEAPIKVGQQTCRQTLVVLTMHVTNSADITQDSSRSLLLPI